MMEFTLARVCMSVCGLVLLAAVIVPVTGIYESKTVRMESDAADGIADLINGFWYSETETLTVPMSGILPGTGSFIEFGGHIITLTTERGVYKGGTNAFVVSDGIVFGYGDIMMLTKGDGIVTAERLI